MREFLLAAEHLATKGVDARVLDMHTVKPLDDAAILKAAQETGRIVVAEEHLLHGGLGSAVALTSGSESAKCADTALITCSSPFCTIDPRATTAVCRTSRSGLSRYNESA